MLQAFDVVERSFLESIDDALAEKASLQSQLPEVTSPACSPGEVRRRWLRREHGLVCCVPPKPWTPLGRSGRT